MPEYLFLCSKRQTIKNKQLKILLNYFVGPIVFVWLSYRIYGQIMAQQQLHNSWQTIRASLLGKQSRQIGLVLLLMLANWGLEAQKWQYLIRNIEKISFWKALKAIFSGQALALNTPNRTGEFAGRIIYLQEGNRLRGIMLLLVANISQLVITFLFGTCSLWMMGDFIKSNLIKINQLPVYSYQLLTASVGAFTILLMLVYYHLSWLTMLSKKFKYFYQYRFLIEELEHLNNRSLCFVLLLSGVRFLVFTLQYILLLQAFDVQMPWQYAAALTAIQFLVMAIVPSIALGELGIRGQISIVLFGIFSHNLLGIVATSAGIWVINLIIPAIAGSICMLTIKIFNKN